jgi:hypothetical protein
MNTPVDYLGRTIRPGDLVVYSWRRGSMMGLAQLNVSQVSEANIVGYNPVGRRVTLRNLYNVVVVERPQTTPKGLSDATLRP